MALVITTTDFWHDSKRLTVVGTIAASGTYPTGGDTLSFAGVKGVLSSTPPTTVQIAGSSGFIYQFVAGTTIANGKMKVLVATTGGTNIPLAEHTNVAYVAGVTGDVIGFEAIFKMR